MSKFAIYNYNFLRIIEPNEEHQLEFPDWENVNVKESFENRQQLLEELLLADYDKPFQFENARKKLYWHKQIVKPQDNVYVMRVANVLGILRATPYDGKFVLEESIQAISDAVGVNVRAYIANHADFGTSNTTFSMEMHDKIKKLILSAIG